MISFAARASPPARSSDPLQLLFEGLFVRALPQEASFRAALRQAGFDPEAGRKSGGVRLFADCLELARRQFFEGLAPEAAFHRLGRLLVEGLAQTAMGRMAAMTLPLLGPARLFSRLPPSYALPQEALRVMPEQLGQRTWLLEFRGEPRLMPEFAAGAVEEILRRCKATPAVSVVRGAAPGDFDLRVCW
jgi:uncharacterized protein (TIGR02265 family)